jgi:prevent-host-death family protein
VADKNSKAGASARVPFTAARARLPELVDRARHRGERTVIQRYGRDVAGIVSPEDVELLESLEDRLDLEAARAALREDPKGTPWATVKKRLGL